MEHGIPFIEGAVPTAVELLDSGKKKARDLCSLACAHVRSMATVHGRWGEIAARAPQQGAALLVSHTRTYPA
eukprot:807630-Pleurochrysis_carterae.AAC.1